MKHPNAAGIIFVATTLLAAGAIVTQFELSKPVPVAPVCERVGDALTALPPMQTAPVPLPVAKPKHVSKTKPHPPEVRLCPRVSGGIVGGT